VMKWVVETIKKCSQMQADHFDAVFLHDGCKLVTSTRCLDVDMVDTQRWRRCSPPAAFYDRNNDTDFYAAYLPHVTHTVKCKLATTAGSTTTPAPRVSVSFSSTGYAHRPDDAIQFVLSSNRPYRATRSKLYTDVHVRCATEAKRRADERTYKAYAFQLKGHPGCMVVRLRQAWKERMALIEKGGLDLQERSSVSTVDLGVHMPHNYLHR